MRRGSLRQFFPYVVATTYTVKDSGPDVDILATCGSDGLPFLSVPGNGLKTADVGRVILGFPADVMTDEDVVSAETCPGALHIFTQGAGSTAAAFARPTYRVGIFCPAAYAPNAGLNGGQGTFDPTGPNSPAWLFWLSAETTDSHASNGSDWTRVKNTTIALTQQSWSILRPTFGRGQLAIMVKLPTSTAGANLLINGCGFTA